MHLVSGHAAPQTPRSRRRVRAAAGPGALVVSTPPIAHAPRALLPPLFALALAIALAAWAWPAERAGWRATGIVSAWAGTGLLVACLMLIVREPRLARLLGGLESMYRWHHRCGVAGYVLLLLHPLALALNAWQEQPARAWQLLVPWQQGWSPVIGWVALLALMLGLAVTFEPRVGPRRWRTVHVLLGPAVLLGLVHVTLLLGHALLPWAVVAAAAMLLGWRLLAADLGLQALPYRITALSRPAATMVEATLQPLASTMAVAPGQFVLARFLDSARYRSCGEFHPFTVSGIGANGTLRLTIKALGKCTSQVQSIAAGALVRLQGPFGAFLGERAGRPQLWVAGGIGITPFIAAIRLGPCVQPTALVYLYRHVTDAAFIDELRGMASSDPQLQLIAASTGDDAPELAALLMPIDGLAGREVYVCGPTALVGALLPVLRHRGVSDDSIHHESFDFR